MFSNPFKKGSLLQFWRVMLLTSLFCVGSCVTAADATNIAKGQNATSSGNENELYTPEKAFDGIVNRRAGNREQSRWTSDVKQGLKNNIWTAVPGKDEIYLQVDLGREHDGIRNCLIEWEFSKVLDYRIDISKDGKNWKTAYTCKQKSPTVTETIRLPQSVKARYVRLVIESFERQSWPAVSLYEFGIYDGELPVALSEIAAALEKNIIIKNADKPNARIELKKLPKDVRWKIVGSTNQEVVKCDGRVNHAALPFAMTSELTFELTRGDETVVTPPILFPSRVEETACVNPKPQTVPEITAWCSTASGAFQFSANPSIGVYDRADSPYVRKRFEIFRDELSALTGKKWSLTINSKAAMKNDIVIHILPKTYQTNESYKLTAEPKQITISANTSDGAFWATRTILQVFSTNNNTFPCGTAFDVPRYGLRGFMYDVGRRPITLDNLYDVMRTMSYYKLNDLQLHLSDNYIWLYEYAKSPSGKNATAEQKAQACKEILEAHPGAFRLESNVEGLTATDIAYTKAEFREFVETAALYGVQIVPEIDVPGHALSLVRCRPDLMYRGNVHKDFDVERVAMLDASNAIHPSGRTYREETLAYVCAVFDEYMTGDSPAFAGKVVHIGTDEYYGNAEDYRAFTDSLLKHILKRGYTPRLWGSLSAKRGKTPVIVDGVQMDIWALGWQNPKEAADAGYALINILDQTMYIVPNGKKNVAAYGDFVSLQRLYAPQWQPNYFGNHHLPAGHPQVLGAQFAVWNDNSFRRACGLKETDLFERIWFTNAVIAEKTWSDGNSGATFDEFKARIRKVGLPQKLRLTYPQGHDFK